MMTLDTEHFLRPYGWSGTRSRPSIVIRSICLPFGISIGCHGIR
jgi:hypothetical protein